MGTIDPQNSRVGGARPAKGQSIRCGTQRSGDHRPTAARMLFGRAESGARRPSTRCRFRFRARISLAHREAACRRRVSREPLQPTTSAPQSARGETLSE